MLKATINRISVLHFKGRKAVSFKTFMKERGRMKNKKYAVIVIVIILLVLAAVMMMGKRPFRSF